MSSCTKSRRQRRRLLPLCSTRRSWAALVTTSLRSSRRPACSSRSSQAVLSTCRAFRRHRACRRWSAQVVRRLPARPEGLLLCTRLRGPAAHQRLPEQGAAGGHCSCQSNQRSRVWDAAQAAQGPLAHKRAPQICFEFRLVLIHMRVSLSVIEEMMVVNISPSYSSSLSENIL